MPTPEDELRWREIADFQGHQLDREGLYEARQEESRGEQAVTQLTYGARGVDNLVAKWFELPRAQEWKNDPWSGDTVKGSILRAALADAAILPRLREGDMTLDYLKGGGLGQFFDDARRSMEYVYGLVQHTASGKDHVGQFVEGTNLAAAYKHKLVGERKKLQDKISPDDVGDEEKDPVKRADLIAQLKRLDLSMADAGIDVQMKQEVLERDLERVVMAGETVESVRSGLVDRNKTSETLARLRDKRDQLLQVEQSVMGVGVVADYLRDMLPAQTDLEGVIKLFVGPTPKLPTHLLRFLSLSDQLNVATTSAFKEVMRLCYPEVDKEGKAVWDSRLHTPEHPVNLTANKYSPSGRERFFKDWETVVMADLEKLGIKDSFQLAEDAVSFSTFLVDALTLGGTAYVRNRHNGQLIDGKHDGLDLGKSGSGSMYDRGGHDLSDKVHNLRFRKESEASKGRVAPRPLVAKMLPQEMLYTIMQYTEARYFSDGKSEPTGKSILEMLTAATPAGQREYTMRDFIENMSTGEYFTLMLFAFRACQISDKVDKLPTGRIEPIQQLGGGPEKLVQEHIDTMLGLHKALQTCPYGSATIPAFWAYAKEGETRVGVTEIKKAKDMKTVRDQRIIVNLVSDFMRGATAAHVASGGYEDNKGWRGFVDMLPKKIYERMVVYTNVMTPQQYHLAWEMAKDSSGGGIITEDMVEGDDRVAIALRDILSQDLTISSDSVVNIVQVAGLDGYVANSSERQKAVGVIINKSAEKAQTLYVPDIVIDEANKELAAKGKDKLRKQAKKY